MESKFAGGPMLRTLVEHPYIVWKSEKPLDMGEPTFHAEKTAGYWLQQQTKVHALALVRQTTLNCSTLNQTISLSITSSDCLAHVSLSYPPPPDAMLYLSFVKQHPWVGHCI